MAAPLPPRRRRRRPRRGSIGRPVNGHLYRAAYLFAVLPLAILAFTVSTPAPLAKPLLPESFDTAAAYTLATTDLAADYPDRAPGSAGAGDGLPASGATAWFEQQLRPYRLRLSTETWTAPVAGRGAVSLTNVLATATGHTPDTIVVMAHRDDTGSGPGANDDASGTAALIELARAYAAPRAIASPTVLPVPVHTLVFLSTDGDAFGELGVRHFIASYDEPIDAVINLDAIAGTGEPQIVFTGDRPHSPDPTLVATAAARISEQTGSQPTHVGLLGQLIDLGLPFTLYAQGPFVGAAIPAITLTTAGDRPPPAFGDDRVQQQRLGEMGEAAQELVASLDQDVELAPSSASEVWVGSRTVRGWAIELLYIALLMPVVVTIIDLYALCRRNRITLAPAVRALRSRLGFWLFAGIVFTCFRLLGAWPTGPGRPPDPTDPSTRHWPTVALVALAVVLLAGWAVARQRLVVRRRISSEEQLAGYLSALVALLLVALLVAAINPFALLFVLPALHVWIWLPQLRIARAPVRFALFCVGLVAPALVLGSFAWRFGLGLDAPWYVLQLVSSGTISTLAFALALAGTAAAAQLAAASAGRYSPYPAARERGPRGPLRELVGAVGRMILGRRRPVVLRRVETGP